jgi:hypothetical protein
MGTQHLDASECHVAKRLFIILEAPTDSFPATPYPNQQTW